MSDSLLTVTDKDGNHDSVTLTATVSPTMALISSGRRYAFGQVFQASTKFVGAGLLFENQGGIPAVFQGNPNVAITAIDTSGGIAASRTSGQTPAFFSVSASAMTATGTSDPWGDLEYSWDFGDPSGTETFTNPVTGTTVNANSGQTGPEATYCYRTAGTKTITLSIRGQLNRSAGTYTTTSVTKTVSVSTYNASGGDWYFDSTAAGGGSGTIGSPFNSITDLNTKLGVASAAIHIKKGSSWSGTTGLSTSSPIRVDTYGSGAKPSFTITGGGAASLHIGSASDVVVSGLSFTMSGGTASVMMDLCTGGVASSDIYLDNVDTNATVATARTVILQEYSTASVAAANTAIRGGLWGSSITSSQGVDVPLGIFGMAYQWSFIVGGTISGNTSTPTVFDHHVYPVTRFHSHYRWINFGAGPNRNYCINVDYDSLEGTDLTMDWVHMSGCVFSGTLRGVEGGGQGTGPTTTCLHHVIQSCAFHDLQADGSIVTSNDVSITFRDNLGWNCATSNSANPIVTGGRFFGAGNGSFQLCKVYRNKVYRPVGGVFNGPDSGVWAFEAGSFTVPVVLTDNITQDQRTTNNVNVAEGNTLSSIAAAGSIIDRNQWYGPNATNLWWDTTTPVSFATWKSHGFDANGSVANPNWPDPGNGNFG